MKELHTFCARDCYDSCSLIARVEDTGRLVSLKGDAEHPITQGFTCPRNRMDIKRLYTNRVLWPFVRSGPKPGKTFQQVTIKKSFDLIVEKLRQVLDKYGPEKVLLLDYAGNHGLLTSTFPRRLWNVLGAARTDYTLCNTTGKVAISLHYGLSYGLQPEDLANMKSIIYWGLNAVESFPHAWVLSLKARKHKHAKIIVVDPRRTSTSKEADLWVQPKPGSDTALAFGVARCLIEKGLADARFISEWTTGFDAFKDKIMRWTPDRVQEVTGISWKTVEHLARIYGENQPSAIMLGVGFQKTANGGNAVRATCLLPALVGQHRGFFYANSSGFFLDKEYLSGEDQLTSSPKVISQVNLGEKMANGDFKFVFIYCMNPTLTVPNQNALRKGLCRDDVFVVLHDTHLTETSNFADVILPAQTFLEKNDIIVPWTHWYAGKSSRIVPPLGESLHEIDVMREIATRLGFNHPRLSEDPWNALKICFSKALDQKDFEALLAGKSVRLYYRALHDYQTPSGKIEFYSDTAKKLNYSPLPHQQTLESAREYEFTLLNSTISKYSHTQFQEIFGPIPPIIKMNPQDAHRLGLVQDQVVTIYNDIGRCTVKVSVSRDVPQGVLWTPKQHGGMDNTPMNALCSGVPQVIGGGSTYNSTRVSIKP